MRYKDELDDFRYGQKVQGKGALADRAPNIGVKTYEPFDSSDITRVLHTSRCSIQKLEKGSVLATNVQDTHPQKALPTRLTVPNCFCLPKTALGNLSDNPMQIAEDF